MDFSRHSFLHMFKAARRSRTWAVARVAIAVLAIVGLVIVARSARTYAPIALSHPWMLAGALTCGVIFSICKGMTLRACVRLVGGQATAWSATRIFCEGTAVETVTWPGKLWADACRAALIQVPSVEARVTAIAGARLSAACAGAAMSLMCAACLWRENGSHLWISAGTLLVCAAIYGCVRRWRKIPMSMWAGAWRGPMLWALAAASVDLLSISMLAWSILGAATVDFLPRYVLIAAAAAASTSPHGLGILDVGCWLLLTKEFGASPSAAGAVVLAYRITGPGVTIALGSLSAIWRAIPGQIGGLPPITGEEFRDAGRLVR